MQGEQPARHQTKDALANGYLAFSLHDPTTQANEIEPSQLHVIHHQVETEAEPTWDKYTSAPSLISLEWRLDIDGEMHPNGGDQNTVSSNTQICRTLRKEHKRYTTVSE